jgi:3-hydroxyisobutyrate dehydrogenase-like beta-hydroxyacid dehydrogenase
MGFPMAKHLVDSGNDTAIWSHTRSKAEELARAENATVCQTPREVAERSDFIFYCVGDSEMSREVATGRDGLIQTVKPGTVIADCSTISPAVSTEIGAQLAGKEAFFLDAPCTGSRGGAEGGTLTFMIGGDQSAFEKSKSIY